MPTRLVRQRKLNVKSNLHIIREAEIADQDAHDGADRSGFQDSLTSLPKVESGVESKEERVRHVIQASISSQMLIVIGIGTSSPGCHLGFASCGYRWKAFADFHPDARCYCQ